MNNVVTVAVLLLGVIVLTPVANRVRVPQPVALTLFGLALALLPSSPTLDVPAEMILPVVLPPLLFAATQRTTVTEFRSQARAVLVLAVGLTVATAGVVAVVAHWAGLGWPAAFVLGAIVSPPDPVAATAVARRLRLPHHLVTILEGEGMFNDATALVLYKVTLAAAVSGAVSYGGALADLGLALVAGTLVGLASGALTRLVLSRIHDGYAETTVTVLVPFLAYLGAEELQGSGVLAVLAVGLYLRSYAHEATTSQGWLLGRAVWSYADFLVSSLVFALLGFELVAVISETRFSGDTVLLAAVVIATVVLLRGAWVFSSSLLARRRARRRQEPLPSGWRESAVVSWAGMRGVVTVATAAALPVTNELGEPLAGRDAVIVVALACVLLTLVVQGLTLAPLTVSLRVGRDSDDESEVVQLRREAAQAAYDELCRDDPDHGTPQVRTAARLQYEGFLSAQTAMEEARATEGPHVNAAEELHDLLRRATDTERSVVLRKRRLGTVEAAVADEVLRDIEGRALRDFA